MQLLFSTWNFKSQSKGYSCLAGITTLLLQSKSWDHYTHSDAPTEISDIQRTGTDPLQRAQVDHPEIQPIYHAWAVLLPPHIRMCSDSQKGKER